MKKLVCMLLSAVLLFALTSCGEEGSESSAPTLETSSAVQSSEPSSKPEASSAGSSRTSSKNDKPSTAESSKASSKTSSKTTSSAPALETVSVLIPPSFTVKQIAARMEAKGVCKAKDFLKAINEGDYSSISLVKGIKDTDKRCYKLEGYLYPDTYEFYKNSDPEDVILKILKNTEKKISGKYQYSGMTTDQIITLASLIEEECGGGSERKKVSSVIHNRLKIGMKLQLDATVHYLNSLDPADTDKYRYFYNTYNKPGYQCPGLPVGPICSPSAKSLDAAVHPDKTDYLYFSSQGGKYIFQTEEEWKAAQGSKPSEKPSEEDKTE